MTTINIPTQNNRYTFEGPYDSTDYLQDRSGVYAIIDKRPSSNILVYIGESANVKSRILNHDRQSCWKGKRQGILTCAVLYTPNLQQHGRMLIEQEIRSHYPDLCGDR